MPKRCMLSTNLLFGIGLSRPHNRSASLTCELKNLRCGSNHRILEKIAEELLEFEILTGKDLERMFEDNGGMREKEPFSLTRANYTKPLSSTFLDQGNGAGPALLGVPT
uniref:Uncharacterized protein n=1 Tax=Populus trichocarpa TaxID=3694 RepID=B9IPC4_POPTR